MQRQPSVVGPAHALAHAFSHDLGKHLLPAVESATPAQFVEADGAYMEWLKNWIAPERPPYELRPYVAGAHSIGWSVERFCDDETARNVLNSISHYLLYCHSVALPDLTETFLEGLAGRSGTSTDWLRPGFSRYVSTLLHMRPLLDEGIVVLIPTPELFSEESFNPHTEAISESFRYQWDPYRLNWGARIAVEYDMGQLYRRVRELSRFDESVTALIRRADWTDGPGGLLTSEEDRKFFEIDTFQLEQTSRARAVVDSAWWAFDALEKRWFHSDRVDVFLRYHMDEDLVDYLLDPDRWLRFSQRRSSPQTALDYDQKLLRRLVNVSVPGLGAINSADLISVRRNADVFNRWREALAKGLRQLDELKTESPNDTQLRAIQGELARAGIAISAGDDGNVMSRLVKGAQRSLSLGTFAHAAFAAVTGKWKEAAIGATLTVASGSVAAIFRPDRQRAALARLYGVFSPAESE